jgi:hypothetical protein
MGLTELSFGFTEKHLAEIEYLVSQGGNTNFRPVFIVNRRFSVKLKANPFGF